MAQTVRRVELYSVVQSILALAVRGTIARALLLFPHLVVEPVEVEGSAHIVICGIYDVTTWLSEVTAIGLAEGEGVINV